MIYKIYELIGKSKTVPDGYNMTTITHYKLEEVIEWDMKNKYASFEEAHADLIKKRSDFKNRTLTILPIIDINYDGDIVSPQ